jgi:N,N-dimethylformamidase
MTEITASSVQARRTQQAAAIASQPASAAPAVARAAVAATPTFDGVQRFIQLVPGGNGIIYAIQADGSILWYCHTGWQNGSATWASGGPGLQIGTGWQQFRTVLANSDGQLYAVMADGTIRWYKYQVTNMATGAGSWVGGGSGPVIGSGFGAYSRFFGGWGGVIYAVDDNGVMWWFQYKAGDGTSGAGAWANNGVAANIGSGWKEIKRLWADPNGVIYGVRHAGELRWWRYLGTHGEVSWANGGTEVPIGEGWGEDSQKCSFSNGSGVIYAVALDGDVVNGTDSSLYWYQLTDSLSVPPPSPGQTGGTWANSGIAKLVGTGFTVEPSAALQGYASTLSTPPGGSVGISVSTTFPTYTATVVRLAPGNSANPAVMSGPTQYQGRLQTVPTGFRLNGCNWGTDFTISVPQNWPSGVYDARLQSPSGLRYHVVFVVNPATASAPLAVLLPTNTYNAYNYWAGHNQYAYQATSQSEGGLQRIYTFMRPSTSTVVDPPAVISHTLYSDLFLLNWMTASGFTFDCYHDGDLNTSGDWLASYKALVLTSHPEYWTDVMLQNLNTYLSNGGILICTGGNGFYERVTFSSDGNALIFRVPSTGARDTFISQTPPRPEAQVIGANFDPSQPPFMTFAAYQVDQASHPFLAGTGLANGGQFGASAYNGGASGWEVDTPIAAPFQQLAHGLNTGGGAALAYATHAGGGWVFSTNSISYNGALPVDAACATILKNVLQTAIG